MSYIGWFCPTLSQVCFHGVWGSHDGRPYIECYADQMPTYSHVLYCVQYVDYWLHSVGFGVFFHFHTCVALCDTCLCASLTHNACLLFTGDNHFCAVLRLPQLPLRQDRQIATSMTYPYCFQHLNYQLHSLRWMSALGTGSA